MTNTAGAIKGWSGNKGAKFGCANDQLNRLHLHVVSEGRK
jgi:hypothetical protein